MARGYTERKLEVWSLSAHRDGESVNYGRLFKDIAAVRATDRRWTDGNRLVAIPFLSVRDGKVWLIAYEGPTDEQPIFLNVDEAEERSAPLDPGEIMATKTHALIDLASREAIIEYNRRGAKASDIAYALGATGRRLDGWSQLWVDLAPKVDQDFLEAIGGFERIRVASLKLSRPNADWDEWEHALSDVADESNARNANTEMSAGRGESLERNRGIVRFIKDRVADKFPALKNAVVTGSRPGEDAETRVSTTSHQTHQRTSVRLNERGQIDDDDIEQRIEEFDAVRRGHRQEDEAPTE